MNSAITQSKMVS